MSAYLDDDPPRPPGTDEQAWRDLLRYARLHDNMILIWMKAFDPSREEEVTKAYHELGARYSFEQMKVAQDAIREHKAPRADPEPPAPAQPKRWSAKSGPVWQREAGGEIVCHQRRQFAVGQGGFHAGTLKRCGSATLADACVPYALDQADFLYVYDCGAERRKHVYREIDRLTAGQRCMINMLFLSHLDRDHICGVPRLLHEKTGLRVDTIVLPHLDHAERLIAFARSEATRPWWRIERFYDDMIVDPVATLRRFNPRVIILVRDNDDAPMPDGTPRTDPPSGGREGMPWRAGYGAAAGSRDCWSADGPDVVVMQGASFNVGGKASPVAWRLVPYVRRTDAGLIKKFQEAVELLLEWEAGSFSRRMATASTRRDAVTKYRAQLARAYKYVFGDKNLTSLSLYSGPDEPAHVEAVQVAPDDLTDAPDARIGWMGTGDTYLGKKADIDKFKQHFGANLDLVATFVFPHHGSIHNSDPDQLVSGADLWVACAESIHKHWKHPALELKKAVHNAGKRFCQVTSKPGSALYEQVAVFRRQ